MTDRQSRRRHHYSVHGLTLCSEIELAELCPAAAHEQADVTVALGPVEAVDDSAAGLIPDNGSLILTIPAVARYRIAEGRTIVVEPFPGAPKRNIRLYLLGSAFGALLHQRGWLPLHANAIDIDGRAIAFLGESGAGKSTLAAWFHDRGFPIIADDVCVVNLDVSTEPVVAPGLPRLRLWAEALEQTGRSPEGFERSYIDARMHEKFDVPIAPEAAATATMRLGGIYLLDRGDAFSIAPIHGIEAMEVLFANTYRGSFIGLTDNAERHFQACSRLAASVPVHRLVREWGWPHMDEQNRAVLDHARQLDRKSAASR